MKNILKALLVKSKLTKNSTELFAQVSTESNVGVAEIVDELIKEGLDLDREVIMDVVKRFNQKSAEMVVTGHSVNTGLVRMRPTIKGSFYTHDWNPNINWVDVILMHGKDLNAAITDTTVQIIGEQSDDLSIIDSASHLIDNKHEDTLNCLSEASRDFDIPACGIAFRQWLFNS